MPEEHRHEHLGELLLAAGCLTRPQLQAALENHRVTGRKLGRVLVEDGILSEEDIIVALAHQKRLERVRLTASTVDPAAAARIPLRVALRHGIIPIADQAGMLTLAMSDPLNIEAIDDVAIITGRQVKVVVASSAEISAAISQHLAEPDAIQELIESEGGGSSGTEDAINAESTADDSVAVVRIINQLIRQAVAQRASDIHFQPDREGVAVRFRVDGVMHAATHLPKSSQNELLSRVKVMAELDITERRRPQDGRISIRLKGGEMDVRVATLPTPRGESITLRLLDSGEAFRPLDTIGLPSVEREILDEMLHAPYGMVLVSGPTGSGKSTTLYAALNELNKPERRLISIEDPIEYTMDGITQVGVNAAIGLTFAAGLRTVLRSDPDVVMLGEIRDAETAETSVRAALTGHLLLSSIHTNDAPSTLTRLNDMGVPSYITSSALLGVIAQRLVRVLCPQCKRPVTLSDQELLAAGFDADAASTAHLHEPVGCDECNGTGYKGRLGVFEVMRMSPQLGQLSIDHAPSDAIRAAALAEGMRPMRRDALEKAALGVTTLAEIDRVVV